MHAEQRVYMKCRYIDLLQQISLKYKIVQITLSPVLKKKELEDSTAVDLQECLERNSFLQECLEKMSFCVICGVLSPLPLPNDTWFVDMFWLGIQTWYGSCSRCYCLWNISKRLAQGRKRQILFQDAEYNFFFPLSFLFTLWKACLENWGVSICAICALFCEKKILIVKSKILIWIWITSLYINIQWHIFCISSLSLTGEITLLPFT